MTIQTMNQVLLSASGNAANGVDRQSRGRFDDENQQQGQDFDRLVAESHLSSGKSLVETEGLHEDYADVEEDVADFADKDQGLSENEESDVFSILLVSDSRTSLPHGHQQNSENVHTGTRRSFPEIPDLAGDKLTNGGVITSLETLEFSQEEVPLATSKEVPKFQDVSLPTAVTESVQERSLEGKRMRDDLHLFEATVSSQSSIKNEKVQGVDASGSKSSFRVTHVDPLQEQRRLDSEQVHLTQDVKSSEKYQSAQELSFTNGSARNSDIASLAANYIVRDNPSTESILPSAQRKERGQDAGGTNRQKADVWSGDLLTGSLPRESEIPKTALQAKPMFVSASAAKADVDTIAASTFEDSLDAKLEYSNQTVKPNSSLSTPPSGLQRVDIPRHLAFQLQDILRAMPDRPVDISLRPEELGRVRLSIITNDSGVTLSVLAERQDTLDLMRRHADALAKEFSDMGFTSVDLAFEQGTDSGFQNDDEPDGNQSSNISLEYEIKENVGLTDGRQSDLDPTRALDKRI
ncbi:MAG: flagellar hook-length control protein FliK [Aliishimia sp.]